jgi:hypothetical protein
MTLIEKLIEHPCHVGIWLSGILIFYFKEVSDACLQGGGSEYCFRGHTGRGPQ